MFFYAEVQSMFKRQYQVIQCQCELVQTKLNTEVKQNNVCYCIKLRFAKWANARFTA